MGPREIRFNFKEANSFKRLNLFRLSQNFLKDFAILTFITTML